MVNSSLQVKLDSGETKLIDVDTNDCEPPNLPEPEPTPAPPTPVSDPKDATPLPETTASLNGDVIPVGITPAKRPANDSPVESSEYASPAFLKRARLSYGSLFEGGMDIFEEEEDAATSREKKRPRFSTSWRYTSRSPSPSPERPPTPDGGDIPMVNDGTSIPSPRMRPAMVDGGCQTDALDFTPPRAVEVAAESRLSRLPPTVFHTPSKLPPNDAVASQHVVSPFDSPRVSSGRIQNEVPVEPGASEDSPAPGLAKPTSQHSSVQTEQPPQTSRHSDEAEDESASKSHHEPERTSPSPFIGSGTSQIRSQPSPPSKQRPSEDVSLTNSQPQSEQNVQGGRRHTLILDHIAEPEQAFRPQASAPPAESSVPKDTESIEIPSSSPQEDGALAVNEQDNPEASEEQSVNEQDESFPEPAQAGLESDEIPEDRGGPDENFGSQTFAEKRFVTDDTNQTVSGDGDPTTVPGGASDIFVEDARRDAGGDYDITHYPNLSNVQDDDEGSDVESDYSDPDRDHFFDPYGRGNEDDEIDEGVERVEEEYEDDEGGYEDYESYDEGESEEEEENDVAAAPAPVARGPPEVISLLSDSEDEDEAPPAPRVTALTRASRLAQFDGSSNVIQDTVAERAGESEATDGGESLEENETDHSEEEVDDGKEVDEEDSETEEARDSKEIPQAEEVEEPSAADEQKVVDEQKEADDQRAADEQKAANVQKAANKQREAKQREVEDKASETAQAIGSEGKDDQMDVDSDAPIERTRQGSSKELKPSPSPKSHRESSPGPKMTGSGTAASSPQQSERLEIMSPIQPSQALQLIRAEEHLIVASTAKAPATADSDISMEQSSPTHAAHPPGGTATTSVVEEASEVSIREVHMASASSQVDEMEAVNAQLLTESNMIYTGNMHGLQMQREEETGEDVEMKDADEGDNSKHRSNSPMNQITPPASQHKDVAMDKKTDQSRREVEEEGQVSDEHKKAQLPIPAATQQVQESMNPHGEAGVGGDATEHDSDKAAEGDQINHNDSEPQKSKVTLGDVPKSPAPGKTQQAKTPPRVADRRGSTHSSPRSQREARKLREVSLPVSEATTSFSRDDRSADETAAVKTRSSRRRGQTKTRAGSKERDPSVQLARASLASRRPTLGPDQTPSDNVRITRSASHNHNRSISADLNEDTSVALAKEALKSPSRAVKGGDSEENASSASLKLQLGRSMRADVPDCVPLRMLRYNLGRTVDVLGIVTTEPPEPKRAKGGPRGVLLAFNITDHSVAPTQVTLVHIFRAHKTALPIVHPGDAVLLRQFTVAAVQGRGFGLRANDGSSWAVFEGGVEEEMPPQIRGPPVELSKGEKRFGALLKTWYTNLDEASMAKLKKLSEKVQNTAGTGTVEGERA